jgi:hypothetical protein
VTNPFARTGPDPDQGNWLTVTTAEQVTDEILRAAEGIADGRYPEGTAVEWADLLDRLDGSPLDNGQRIDLGGDLRQRAGGRSQIRDQVATLTRWLVLFLPPPR